LNFNVAQFSLLALEYLELDILVTVRRSEAGIPESQFLILKDFFIYLIPIMLKVRKDNL